MKNIRIVIAITFSAGLGLQGSDDLRVRAQGVPDPEAIVRRPAQSASSSGQLDAGMRQVTDAYALIEKNFAEDVPADKAFYQGAIPGMLGTLDPHSSFLDPSDYAEMQRNQRAQYFGVGMLISVDNGNTVAYEPFPGSPAKQVGLRRGDIIAAVDGVNALGMNSQKVADML